ncbi:MAG: hypothetical protein KAI24_06515, partial [Planctomycetes bacterium]|nr:hypothetical protein [Planctomycetota bacterium]
VASLTAQERRVCLGVVRGPGGVPLAGAEVTAVYASPGDGSFLHDRQVAVADERGRFRLPLWNDVSYDYVAIGPADEHGARFVSRLHIGATGGGLLTIEAQERQDPRDAVFDGLAAWRELGAAAITVHLGAKDVLGAPLDVDEQGRCSLPPLPASHVLVQVRDQAGAPLVLGLVGPEPKPKIVLGKPERLRVKAAAGIGGGGRLVLDLRAPTVWNEGELWVAAPRFVHRDLGAFVDGGEVVVPRRPDPDPNNYWWRASRLTLQQAGVVVAQVPLAADLRADQDSAHVKDGVVTLPAIAARWPVDLADAAADEAFLCVPRRGATNRDAVEVGAVLDADALRAGAPLDDGWAACDVFRRGRGRAALERCAVLWPPGGGEPVTDLRDVEVTVIDALGGPGAHAWVAAVPIDEDKWAWSDEHSWTCADSGGRVWLRLPAGTYGLYATDGVGLAATQLVVAADPVRPRLALERLPTLTVQLLGADDRPLAGVHAYSMTHGTVDGGLSPFEQQRHRLANAFAYRLCVRRATDEEGRVTIPVLEWMGVGGNFMFRLPGDGRSEPIALEPSDEVLVVH